MGELPPEQQPRRLQYMVPTIVSYVRFIQFTDRLHQQASRVAAMAQPQAAPPVMESRS